MRESPSMDLSKWLRRALVLLLLVFGVTTAFAMTVRGVLEPASLDVDHFDAGAGGELLRLRVFLVLGASGVALLWARERGTAGERLARLAIIPGLFLCLAWSLASLNRFAPGFSEEQFDAIRKEQMNGRVWTVQDVEKRLGPPLLTSREDDRTVWSYTYTPSGGYGWPKRVFIFDPRGVLVHSIGFDEP